MDIKNLVNSFKCGKCSTIFKFGKDEITNDHYFYKSNMPGEIFNITNTGNIFNKKYSANRTNIVNKWKVIFHMIKCPICEHKNCLYEEEKILVDSYLEEKVVSDVELGLKYGIY